MEGRKMKKELNERFNTIYKGCTLYAVQLNGFSHKVFYKDKDNKKHIDTFSAYSPEQKNEEQLHYDNVYRSFNDEKTWAFLSSYSHYNYQGRPIEFTFRCVSEW